MREVSPDGLKEARSFIAAARWTFAKTMPETPHEYSLRRDARDDGQFARFVAFSREHGYDAEYGVTTYRYLDVDGWSYWTMGAPLDETILINRTQR